MQSIAGECLVTAHQIDMADYGRRPSVRVKPEVAQVFDYIVNCDLRGLEAYAKANEDALSGRHLTITAPGSSMVKASEAAAICARVGFGLEIRLRAA